MFKSHVSKFIVLALFFALSAHTVARGLKRLPAQMHDAWVTNVISRMQQQGGSLATLVQTLGNNRTLITKTVTAVDKARKVVVFENRSILNDS